MFLPWYFMLIMGVGILVLGFLIGMVVEQHSHKKHSVYAGTLYTGEDYRDTYCAFVVDYSSIRKSKEIVLQIKDETY